MIPKYEDLLRVEDYLGVRISKEYYEYAMSQGIKLIIKPDHAAIDDRPSKLGVDYHRPKKQKRRRNKNPHPLEGKPSYFRQRMLKGGAGCMADRDTERVSEEPTLGHESL